MCGCLEWLILIVYRYPLLSRLRPYLPQQSMLQSMGSKFFSRIFYLLLLIAGVSGLFRLSDHCKVCLSTLYSEQLLLLWQADFRVAPYRKEHHCDACSCAGRSCACMHWLASLSFPSRAHVRSGCASVHWLASVSTPSARTQLSTPANASSTQANPCSASNPCDDWSPCRLMEDYQVHAYLDEVCGSLLDDINSGPGACTFCFCLPSFQWKDFLCV